MPRLLLVLPQNPRDPCSGAALSLWTMARWLSRDGWEVSALGTSHNEKDSDSSATAKAGPRWLEETTDGIPLAIVSPAAGTPELLRRAQDALISTRPDLLLTYGDTPGTLALLESARAAGVFSIFGLRNNSYRQRLPPAAADICLAPSRATRDLYRQRLGLNVLALPPPIDTENLLASGRQGIVFSFVNPSFVKGAFWMSVLLRDLAGFRPDLPVQITAGRGSFAEWVRESARHGCPLENWPNLFLRESAAHPAELFQHSRALLFPSFQEAAGRVVLEALANGVPPLVFAGGAPQELAGDAAIVPPVPPGFNGLPPSPGQTRPWLEAMARLADDEDWLNERSAAALRRAETFSAQRLTPIYANFFASCLRRSPEADEDFW